MWWLLLIVVVVLGGSIAFVRWIRRQPTDYRNH